MLGYLSGSWVLAASVIAPCLEVCLYNASKPSLYLNGLRSAMSLVGCFDLIWGDWIGELYEQFTSWWHLFAAHQFSSLIIYVLSGMLRDTNPAILGDTDKIGMHRRTSIIACPGGSFTKLFPVSLWSCFVLQGKSVLAEALQWPSLWFGFIVAILKDSCLAQLPWTQNICIDSLGNLLWAGLPSVKCS